LQSNGEPAAAAEVLVTDRETSRHLADWYRADTSGRAKIDLDGSPAVLVILFGGMLFSQELSEGAPSTIRLPASVEERRRSGRWQAMTACYS